jgi:hypothetical protein
MAISKFNGNTILKFLLKLTLQLTLILIYYIYKNISYGIKQILVGHFISAIVFVVFSLFAGDNYTIDHVLNGKKDDPILISERYVEQLPAYIKDKTAVDQTMIINRFAQCRHDVCFQKIKP